MIVANFYQIFLRSMIFNFNHSPDIFDVTLFSVFILQNLSQGLIYTQEER